MRSVISRRQVLHIGGSGLATGLLTGSVGGRSLESVFVHPADEQRPEQAADAARDHGGSVTHRYDNFAFIVASVPRQRLDELRRDRRVSLVELDGSVEAIHHKEGHDGGGGGGGDECSDHPTQDASWGYDRIGAGEVTETTGAGVEVAILDTGIDSDHCDLTVAGGRNFTQGNPHDYEDRNGHGSHCAGIVGADDNSIGVVGVAPDVDLYAAKVLNDDGRGSWSNVISGIDWCVTNRIEIFSMSIGGGFSQSLADALWTAYNNGHLFVAAAGNNGNDGDGDCEEKNVTYPGFHYEAVCVSALAKDDTIAGYSSVGVAVDVIAPGTRVRSTYKDDGYRKMSGTSMACPHVTGVAALVWDASGATLVDEDEVDNDPPREESTLEPNDEVKNIIYNSADDLGMHDCEQGAGLVDAAEAVTNATQ